MILPYECVRTEYCIWGCLADLTHYCMWEGLWADYVWAFTPLRREFALSSLTFFEVNLTISVLKNQRIENQILLQIRSVGRLLYVQIFKIFRHSYDNSWTITKKKIKYNFKLLFVSHWSHYVWRPMLNLWKKEIFLLKKKRSYSSLDLEVQHDLRFLYVLPGKL